MAEELLENVDELFEEKSTSTSKTKSVGMKISEFQKKIEEKKTLTSPRFMLDGFEFCIHMKLQPSCEKYPEFISVYLRNCSKKDQTISLNLVEGSGAQEKYKMKEIKVGGSLGFPRFLSPDKFKTWAFIHGDVLKLKATVTLHQKGTVDGWTRSNQVLEVPKSLGSEATVPALNKAIMLDVDTADFTVRCQTKSFKVHKNFLCSRSPVLRAMILGKMKEAQKSEVFIEDFDAETLALMISFIYTGDFDVGVNTDLKMLARAADKYNIKGIMDLLCFKMMNGNIRNDFIADMLITADRHKSKELRAVALEKLRADRSIMKTDGFRQRMMMAENKNLIFDLVNDL